MLVSINPEGVEFTDLIGRHRAVVMASPTEV